MFSCKDLSRVLPTNKSNVWTLETVDENPEKPVGHTEGILMPCGLVNKDYESVADSGDYNKVVCSHLLS